MSMSKSSKMLQFINYRLRVTILDGRQLVGKFMAFDRHMNLVLGDCEEFRKLSPAKGKKNNEERDDRRALRLVLLRGEEVRRGSTSTGRVPGQGLQRCRHGWTWNWPWRRKRHLRSPTRSGPGLSGPVRGVGGPAPGMMQPQISRPPIPKLSAPPMNYLSAPVLRLPGQIPGYGPPQMARGPSPSMHPPPQFAGRPGGPPQFPGPPPPTQFSQRPMRPPGQIMRGPPPPLRPGMTPPPGGVPVPVYLPSRGMPPPPNAQNQQQQ